MPSTPRRFFCDLGIRQGSALVFLIPVVAATSALTRAATPEQLLDQPVALATALTGMIGQRDATGHVLQFKSAHGEAELVLETVDLVGQRAIEQQPHLALTGNH